jgi:hypothetical protein
MGFPQSQPHVSNHTLEVDIPGDWSAERLEVLEQAWPSVSGLRGLLGWAGCPWELKCPRMKESS